MPGTETVGGVAVDLIVNSKDGVAGMNAFASSTGVTDDRIKKLNETLPEFNENISKVKNSSGQARQALTGFSQIIQDAPYGIRGVGNNIEFFTQAMSNLIASTGSVKLGLQAMLSVFTGPAGLMFIVSAAVSILTVLSTSFSKTKKDAEEASMGILQYRDSIKEVEEQLDKMTPKNEVFTKEQATQELDKVEARLKIFKEILRARKDQQQFDDKSIDVLFNKADQIRSGLTDAQVQYFAKTGNIQSYINNLEQYEIVLQRIASSKSVFQDTDEKSEEKRTKEIEHEVKRDEARMKSIEKRAKAETDLLNKIDELTIESIVNEFDLRRAKSEQQLNKDLADIDELAMASQDYDEQQRAYDAAREAHKKRLLKITDDETKARLEAEKKVKDEQDKAERKRLQDMEELIQGVDRLGNALHRALGKSGDDFVQKMVAALQVALQIAKTMEKANGSQDGMGAGDILSIVADVAGLIAMFDSGGVVSGTKGSPQLILAHSGEMVLPTHKYPLGEAIARASRNSTSGTTMFDSGGVVSTGYDLNAGVIQELRALRQDVRSMQIQQPIIFENILNFQQILRKEMSAYNEYKKSKYVD